MSVSPDISDILLGELDPDERVAVERALAADPELREDLARLRPLVRRLQDLPDAAWQPPTPPPLRLPDAPTTAARRHRGAWSWIPRPLAAATAAAALVALGVAGGLWLGRSDEPPATATVTLEALAAAPAGADGVATLLGGDADRLRLRVDGLAPSGPGDFYELWLLDDPESLVSLGSFRVPPSGATSVEVPLPVAADRYRIIDVSLEPDDGDPAHSGQSVLQAPTPG